MFILNITLIRRIRNFSCIHPFCPQLCLHSSSLSALCGALSSRVFGWYAAGSKYWGTSAAEQPDHVSLLYLLPSEMYSVFCQGQGLLIHAWNRCDSIRPRSFHSWPCYNYSVPSFRSLSLFFVHVSLQYSYNNPMMKVTGLTYFFCLESTLSIFLRLSSSAEGLNLRVVWASR